MKKSIPKTATKAAPALSPETQEQLNKAIERITNPRPKAIEFRAVTSIRERAASLNTLLTLITASASYDSSKGPTDANEVLEAIQDAAVKAREEVYALTCLPASVGNLPALTYDEYQDHGVDAHVDSQCDDWCRARMRQMLGDDGKGA